MKEKGKRLQKIQELDYIAVDQETEMYAKATQQKMKSLLKQKMTKTNENESEKIDIQL